MISFFKKPEVKENPTGQAYIMPSPLLQRQKLSPKTAYEEAYQKNVIAYRAINEITKSIGCIELELHQNGKYVEDGISRIAPFINRPNPLESWDVFISARFVDFLNTGEIFISSGKAGKKLIELWGQSPINMEIKGGKGGIASEYIFKANNVTVSWPVDQLTGQSDILFYKMYDPLNYWRGMSPLMAASMSVDAHNAGLLWNYSLLKNGARPSGVLKMAGSVGSEVAGRLKEFFKRTVQGPYNAGEIPILTDGAEWQAMDNSPQDMDYINTMKETTKYIAAAIGVPLPLIDNDASSYNNIDAAQERLYTNTIIPLYESFLVQFSHWLQQYIGEGYELKINMDSIPALEKVRERKFERMIKAVEKGVLSINEAREELGYKTIPGLADSLLVPSNSLPIDMLGFDGMTPDEQDTASSMRSAKFTEAEIRQLLEADRKCQH